METHYEQRYPGPRWALYYGVYDGIQKVAVNDLQRMVQSYLPYVIETHKAFTGAIASHENLILVGTGDDNPLIAELIQSGKILIPDKAESYHIACFDAPWEGKQRAIVIAGRDAKGVLNGVHAFGAQVLSTAAKIDQDLMRRDVIDKLADFSATEKPAVEERGLWTWGYVIYDYRGFLDTMARLRMNTLVVWNDEPPVNAADFLAYAHDRGIKVIMGFHWGWGLEHLDFASAAHNEMVKEAVVKNYVENYRHLAIDGIYFQTLTEHNRLDINGKSTATLASEWVNRIAQALLDLDPGLRIIFGLHATSIREHYTDLTALDTRVSIMWEDAGVLPYTYAPTLGEKGDTGISDEAFEDTLAYSKRLATFRPGTPFEIVPKGYMSLRWGYEFEHHGPFIIGERSPEFIEQRARLRQIQWDRVNALWLRYFPYGARFYREILDCAPSRMTAVALVEDAMFEARIQPSVSLFAETLWNPRRSDTEILHAALSPYYEHASIS